MLSCFIASYPFVIVLKLILRAMFFATNGIPVSTMCQYAYNYRLYPNPYIDRFQVFSSTVVSFYSYFYCTICGMPASTQLTMH